MTDAQQPRLRIKASAQDVFDCWVTPESIEDWWGPDGFTTVVRDLDLTEGGRFTFEMTAPDGSSCMMTGTYQQIQPPSLLVFELTDHCNLCLPDGVQPQRAPSLVSVRIEEDGEYSEVSVSHTSLVPTYSPLAAASWSQSLKKLAEKLA